MPHPPAANVIEIAGLQKDYRGLRPLRIRSLVVRAGERVGIDGPDAPAAEELVNLITAATLPDEGEVRIFGHSTREVSADRRAERAILVETAKTISDSRLENQLFNFNLKSEI